MAISKCTKTFILFFLISIIFNAQRTINSVAKLHFEREILCACGMNGTEDIFQDFPFCKLRPLGSKEYFLELTAHMIFLSIYDK